MVLTRLTMTSTTKMLSIREAIVAGRRLRTGGLCTLGGSLVQRQLVLVRAKIKVEVVVMFFGGSSNVVKPCHNPDTCMYGAPYDPSTPPKAKVDSKLQSTKINSLRVGSKIA
jgi:hypothetical protein